MASNTGKCHYICLRKNAESDALYFNYQIYTNSKVETVLGIITENKLSF